MENQERPKTIEEQFEHRETVELYGGKVEVVDVSPERPKTKVPVVVAPGWSASPDDFRGNIIALAQSGRRAISVHAPHGIEHELPEEHNKLLPDAELRKVAALVNSLEMKDIDTVDVVAHSEAALFSTVAAYLYPERFRNLVLVNPAGLIGEDNIARLMVSFSAEVVRQTIEDIREKRIGKPFFQTLGEITGYISKKPLQVVREILAMSNSQIHEILRELKQRGTGISIVSGNRDLVFPTKKMKGVLSPDMFSGFYEVAGRHNDVYTKSHEYNPLIMGALDKMEEERDK